MKKLIIIAGPTAAGKTAASVKLAKLIDGEIISADSMQVYKYIDIGSAKIREEEKEGIRHHLIDILMPDEVFNIVVFQKLAKQALEDIYSRGRTPIIAGGTGFYIQSVLYDINFDDEEDDKGVRAELEKRYDAFGAEAMHRELAAVDAASASAIHMNNRKRVIRALEYYINTGKPISEHNETERKRKSPYDFRYFVINRDRELLYRNIDLRVDRMLEEGLEAEVRKLKSMGYTRELVSMQGLGYKEMLEYLDGSISLDEAVYMIKRDTRHFAKRQLTWFKREKDAIWLENFESAEELAKKMLKLSGDSERFTKKPGNILPAN